MSSKQFWVTATATVLALSAFGPRSSGVWAQSEIAACQAGWEWNRNSLGQDPCVISSMLDAACRGVGSYSVPPLNSTQNYVPPQQDSTSDLTCDCDTVMYSLYMACTTCQGGMIYSWTRWISECTTVYVSQYPHDIPQGTAIPRWAFYNITTLPEQTYNDTVATAVGRDPEATPNAVSTVTLGSSTLATSTLTLSLTSSSSSAPDPTNTTDGSGGTTNTGAIVGGVAGGVVSVAILAVAAFFVRRRKQGGKGQPLPPPSQSQEVLEFYTTQPAPPVFSPSNSHLPYNPYYNPEDPTTFPPPIGSGQSSLTYVNQLSPHGSHSQGQYSGIPEI